MKISLNILSKFILFYFFTRKQLKKTESFFAVHTWRLVDQISDCFAVVQIHFIEKEGIAQRKWSCMAGIFLDTTSLSCWSWKNVYAWVLLCCHYHLMFQDRTWFINDLQSASPLSTAGCPALCSFWPIPIVLS